MKQTAGKIIPALATTTSSVCGLVVIELFKLVQGNKNLDAFKDSSNNLGNNSFFFSTPMDAIKSKDEYDPIEMAEIKCKPSGFTKWDKTLIAAERDVTLSGFLDAVANKTGLICTALFHAQAEVKNSQILPKYI